MSRGGHAGHMTQLIVERMAALDGPATVDEITDAVAAAAHVPWNYIFQRYQQNLCQKNEGREGTISDSMVPSDGGWVAPNFDPNDPVQRRKALRYVIQRRLYLHSTEARSGKRRRWAAREGDDRFYLNPDETQMPRIREFNGRVATFDSTTRAEIGAGKSAQAAVITRGSDRRTFDRLEPAAQATLLRWLTDQLIYDRGAASRTHPILADWKRRELDHDAALAKLRDLLCTT